MMWNPPWLVMLLSPVLSFGFLTSCAVWLGVSIVLIGHRRLPRRAPTCRRAAEPLVVGAMFLFEPHLSSIRFGQLGIPLRALRRGVPVRRATERPDDDGPLARARSR
jgi:hypothetical protein